MGNVKKDPNKRPWLKDAREKHLWKPGESGNPKGGPVRALTLAKNLRDRLERPASEVPILKQTAEIYGLDPESATIIQVLVLSMICQAMNGSTEMMKEIWNRVDGKITDQMQVQFGPLPGSITTLELENKVRQMLEDRKRESS